MNYDSLVRIVAQHAKMYFTKVRNGPASIWCDLEFTLLPLLNSWIEHQTDFQRHTKGPFIYDIELTVYLDRTLLQLLIYYVLL